MAREPGFVAAAPEPVRRRRRAFAPLEPVRVRITLAATIAFGLAFAGASVALVHTVRNSLEAHTDAETNDAMQRLANQLKQGKDPSKLSVGRESIYYEVYTPSGQVIAGSASRRLPVLVSGSSHLTTVKSSGGTTYKVDWADLRIATKSMTLAIAAPSEVRRSVDTLARSLWVGTPFLILLVGMVVWVLVGRALRPVEALRLQVDDISGTTLDRRVPVPRTDDEIARLARTMNGMLDRLEQAAARQRAFVSDASHELRSPVSTIRTELEVAAADAPNAEWPAVAERTLGETERLSRLVDDLLALARLDEASGPVRRAPVDLDDLVIDESARTHRVPLGITGVSAGRVSGDVRQLAQVVRNLVDNAQRHATARVAVSLHSDDGELVLTVDDDGPGIAPADRLRVFDRFTRLDEARGRADGGAGLGLAVVRRVVEQHGGTVTIADSPLGGARFEVRLPAI